MSIDPAIVHAWLSGRSIARGVPRPVAEHGGFRVDSNTDAEVCRWVFPAKCAGLGELGRSLREPRHFLKLCDDADALRSMLPERWRLHPPNHFMQSGGHHVPFSPIEGYRIDVQRTDALVHVRIWSDADVLAASGYAGETPEAFVYDRIVTAPEHRRKGLGRVVMASLQAARRRTGTPELLVATDEGRDLYARLGWRTIAPYSTASIVAA